MIMDIQGCYLKVNEKRTIYMLSDPAIVSKFGYFGTTDMGAWAMTKFFKKHKCNEYCKHLKLRRPTGDKVNGYVPENI